MAGMMPAMLEEPEEPADPEEVSRLHAVRRVRAARAQAAAAVERVRARFMAGFSLARTGRPPPGRHTRTDGGEAERVNR